VPRGQKKKRDHHKVGGATRQLGRGERDSLQPNKRNRINPPRTEESELRKNREKCEKKASAPSSK